MALLVISIRCDNAAFHNPEGKLDPAAELASILANYVAHLRRDDRLDANLYDGNGNRIGSAVFVRED